MLGDGWMGMDGVEMEKNSVSLLVKVVCLEGPRPRRRSIRRSLAMRVGVIYS